MRQVNLSTAIRKPNAHTSIVDIAGEITASTETALMEAYAQAGNGDTRTVILNLTGLGSVDASGITSLVSLLVRAQRHRQRLLAYGLDGPSRQAFDLTRLNEAVGLYATEAEAIAAAASDAVAATPAPASLPARPDQPAATAPDREGWASPVDRLTVQGVPASAINLNVEGRRLVGPLEGFGPMWLKTYSVRLTGAQVRPEELIQTWREHFSEFWPEGNQLYLPPAGIVPGAVGVINLTLPGGMKLATGMLVVYVDEVSFSFMTPQGHTFAGMITFTAREDQGTTVAQVQALLRSFDPLYELTFRLGFGHKAENQQWHHTLKSLAARFGADEQVEQEVVCLDRSIQWSEAKNIWYNAAIRTTLHTPIRWVRGLTSRS